MSDTVLKASRLVKRFNDLLAVDDLNLEVMRGEVLGFLGPNGAGKTTSLRMMCGLLKPDLGTVEINGRRLDHDRARGITAIGVAPQSLVIWENLTCSEQLKFTGQMYGLSAARARERAESLLQALGLSNKAKRLGRTLSGGMQRRLNIALALAHDPEVLFLDEPQAGLDPQSRVLVRDYIKSLRGKMTVIITTHDMEEAEKLSDRVCIIDRGKLLELGAVNEVKRKWGGEEVTEITTDVEVISPDAFRERLPADAGFDVRGGTLCLHSPRLAEALAEALGAMKRQGLRVTAVRTRQSNLEDIFIRMTGRSLRE